MKINLNPVLSPLSYALFRRGGGALLVTLLVGCVPRIEVAAPKEPIIINMNVRIEHEITIRADRDAAQMLENSTNAVQDEIGDSRVETKKREQTKTQTGTATPATAP